MDIKKELEKILTSEKPTYQMLEDIERLKAKRTCFQDELDTAIKNILEASERWTDGEKSQVLASLLQMQFTVLAYLMGGEENFKKLKHYPMLLREVKDYLMQLEGSQESEDTYRFPWIQDKITMIDDCF